MSVISWNSLNTLVLTVVMESVVWGMIGVKRIKLDEGYSADG
jgi:hypothetical protein